MPKAKAKKDVADNVEIKVNKEKVYLLGTFIQYIRQNRGTLDMDYDDISSSNRIAKDVTRRYMTNFKRTISRHEVELMALAGKINCSVSIRWSKKLSSTGTTQTCVDNLETDVGRVQPYILELKFVQESLRSPIYNWATVRFQAHYLAPATHIADIDFRRKEKKDIVFLNNQTGVYVKRQKTKELVKDQKSLREHKDNEKTMSEHGFFLEGGKKATETFLTLCDPGETPSNASLAFEKMENVLNVLEPMVYFTKKMQKGIEHLVTKRLIPSVKEIREQNREMEKEKESIVENPTSCNTFCYVHCPMHIDPKKLSTTGRKDEGGPVKKKRRKHNNGNDQEEPEKKTATISISPFLEETSTEVSSTPQEEETNNDDLLPRDHPRDLQHQSTSFIDNITEQLVQNLAAEFKNNTKPNTTPPPPPPPALSAPAPAIASTSQEVEEDFSFLFDPDFYQFF